MFRSRFEAKKKPTSHIEVQDERTSAERLADQVTPLYQLSYSEQIAKKHKLGTRHLNTLRKKLNNLPDLNQAAKQQLAWTQTL